MEEKIIFDADGDAYLSATLSYASPSCHIAHGWQVSKHAACIKKSRVISQKTEC